MYRIEVAVESAQSVRNSYNKTFLSKPKQNDPEAEPERPRKKHKPSKRNCPTKRIKYEFIRYMHDHEELTALECWEQSQFRYKLKVKQNTAEKWRSEFKRGSQKYKKLKMLAANHKTSKIKKTSANAASNEPKYGLFPSIYMLEFRKLSAEQNRDRSFRWWQKKTRKLLNDPQKVSELNLTQYQQENIDDFYGSKGWIRKVLVC